MRTLIALGIWLAVALSGSAGVLDAGYQTSAPPEAPAEWPLTDHAVRADGHTLVVVLDATSPHPDAALDDLAAIQALAGGRIDTHLVVELPRGAEPDWTDALWSRIRSFDDAVVHLDAGGVIANSFGAMSGGTTLLFGPDGHLVRDAAP